MSTIVFNDASGVPSFEVKFVTVTVDVDVSPVLAGKSAYDIAVQNGFQGSQEEWLESLSNEANINDDPVSDQEVLDDWDAS